MELGYKSPDTYCVVLFNKLLGEGTKQQLALSYRRKINYSHCFLFSKCNFFSDFSYLERTFTMSDIFISRHIFS